MQPRLARQLVLDYLDAFYTGDVLRALDCCDDEIDSITYAPVELFPHLGHKHGKAWPGAVRPCGILHTAHRAYHSTPFVFRFLRPDPAIARPRPDRRIRHDCTGRHANLRRA
jgi:hypothetical protein